jgi:hypothetical protein
VAFNLSASFSELNVGAICILKCSFAIAEAMSHGNIGTKDSLRYLFRKLDVPYSESDLSVLFSTRGKVIHSGRYDNIPDLLQKSDALFWLLVTAVLRLLWWKGAALRY